ncbi:MAG: 3-isopropylmalate dehydrogenase [Bacillaceae bacterium]|nr:3-isopropylmalate dehydrogenase [Bacillaceae bacterium]
MHKRIAILPGDGIGKEIINGAIRVLNAVGEKFDHQFDYDRALIGGDAVDQEGTPLPEETVTICKNSDAVLLGAVGGPKWDQNPSHLRPEKGLLGLRKELGVFSNLRPVTCFPDLADASTLKTEVIEQVDLMIVRELTGGLYFGEPSGRQMEGGQETAVDTLYYTRAEMERIIRKAFELAEVRKKKVTSVDKANVLETSKLWREVADEVAEEFQDVKLEHMLVDNAAMQLIRNPSQFDVIVTENMFGDILSDEASMLTGSLGMLASASLSADGPGLYEPVHGSAPDIAGENKANPLAMILSSAMMLKYSFSMINEANAVEKAVQEVLKAGYRTGDIAQDHTTVLSTDEMTQKVLEYL